MRGSLTVLSMQRNVTETYSSTDFNHQIMADSAVPDKYRSAPLPNKGDGSSPFSK